MNPSKSTLPNALAAIPRQWQQPEARQLASSVLPLFEQLLKHDYGDIGGWTEVDSEQNRVFYKLDKISLGLEITTEKLRSSDLAAAIGRLITDLLNKALVFSSAGFEKDAFDAVSASEPVRVELMDFRRLEEWIGGVEDTKENEEVNRLQIAVSDFSKKLAAIVAENPNSLVELEWRDVERMLAAALEELGFVVELTPPAKDGGRDIDLRCFVFGENRRYLVEIKHWATPVHRGIVRDFLQVLIDEQPDRGLLLATSGYCTNAFEILTEVERRWLKYGDSERMVAICQAFTRSKAGVMVPQPDLPQLLFRE